DIGVADCLRRRMLRSLLPCDYCLPLLTSLSYSLFFFFNDTATTEIYTLSLHDALPISSASGGSSGGSSPTPNASPGTDQMRDCGGGYYLVKEAAAEVLGVSEDDLRTALMNGQSLAQVAEAHGMSVEDFKAALIDKVTADLQAKLDAGNITQAQFDARVADLKANIDDIVNRQGGLRFHDRSGSGESGSGTRFRGFFPQVRVADG